MRLGFDRNSNGHGGAYCDAGTVALGSLLPAIYQEYDENTLRFTSALDAVLAPDWLAIDCFDAYLSPTITPDDTAAWLATWVGIAVDDNWQPDQLRRLLTRSFELYRWRGTARGIADLVEAYTGLRPEVHDSGGVGVSAVPGGATLRTDAASVIVRISAPNLDDAEVERLTALVRSAAPAHVVARVDVAPA
jgi:phage tail-like protein